MGSFRLSIKAEEDLADIYTFSIDLFGLGQAQKYLLGLEECFLKLASTPFLGREVPKLYPGLRIFVYKSHMVFYLIQDEGVFVVRVLHQSRDYKNFV